MLDWVKKLLFEDEEIVVEENKLEKIDFTKVNNFENIISDEKETEKVEEAPKIEMIEIEKEEPISYKKEFNIQLTEPTPVQEVVVERKRVESKRPERERPERTERTEKETNVEIMTVISPIYGGKEVKKSTTNTNVTVTPKRKDSLGTVISPMYGQHELQKHQLEATARIEENKNKQMPLVEDDDWKNDIPLDELISSADETTDCVQFSLFGDEQSINE